MNKLFLDKIQSVKVAVIGDVMLDQYWMGQAERISPEAPVPVVHISSEKSLPGGAGNVARNLAALGAKPTLFGVIGDDKPGEILEQILKTEGVETHFQIMSTKPTITKLRILSHHQQIVRLDHEESLSGYSDALIAALVSELSQFDAVIVSDYHKGTLGDLSILMAAAKASHVPVLVDPKGESFAKYHGATFITPNRREFEMVVGACQSNADVETAAMAAISQHGLSGILVTRGSEGMSLVQPNKPTCHLPVESLDVTDVTGAGDTVIAVMAAALAAKATPKEAAVLANKAASLSVQRLGAAAITHAELTQLAIEQPTLPLGVTTVEGLLAFRDELREQGKRLVFTNGCFDILHPGHIGYLNDARACGDCLVVALNTDASVKRIKGADRPVKTLADRMAVLAGFRSVDWVIAFDEDTPLDLIKAITPDVLVKGTDYQVETVVGADHVISQGGEVRLVGPEKVWSTTDLIEKCQLESIET